MKRKAQMTVRPRKPAAPKGLALAGLPVAWDSVARDAVELVSTARRVRAYRAFLARARSAKASRLAPDIDREVLAQARAIQEDGQRAAAATARVMRSLHAGGAFAHVADSLTLSLKADGPVRSTDLWTSARGTQGFREYLEKYGIDDEALDEFGALVARTDLTMSSKGADIVMKGSVDGAPVSGRIAARRAPGLPRNPLDLLTASTFDALCDALERKEPAYLIGTGGEREPLHLEDVLMMATLASQRESIRHVRKLDDVGLVTHAGGDVTTVILVIAAAVLLIGIIIEALECPPGGDPNDPNANTACKIGGLMVALGGFVLVGIALHERSKAGIPVARQTISGPLPQLQGQPA
jgi:hypothetical protein